MSDSQGGSSSPLPKKKPLSPSPQRGRGGGGAREYRAHSSPTLDQQIKLLAQKARDSPPLPTVETKEKTTYAEVIESTRKTPAPASEDLLPTDHEKLRQEFVHLLENYYIDGNGQSYYKRRSEDLAKLGRFQLEVDFFHLASDKRYKYLMVEIMRQNDQGNSGQTWLESKAREFLNKDFDFAGDSIQQLGFTFVNCPVSLRALSEFSREEFVSKICLMGEYWKRRVNYKGRQVYISAIDCVLLAHTNRLTWDGNFKLSDMLILEFEDGKYRCFIMADQKLNPCTPLERVNDLKKVGTLVTPLYELDKEMPAYFGYLHDDLANLTVEELLNTSFLSYLPYNPAIMPLGAIKQLVEEIYHVSRNITFVNDEDRNLFVSIFQTLPGLVLKDQFEDWRNTYNSSKDPILYGVYWYENEKNDKFKPTRDGKLIYKRHITAHAGSHMKKAKSNNIIISSEETELYSSSEAGDIVHEILRILFEGRDGIGMKKNLRAALELYCRQRDA